MKFYFIFKSLLYLDKIYKNMNGKKNDSNKLLFLSRILIIILS